MVGEGEASCGLLPHCALEPGGEAEREGRRRGGVRQPTPSPRHSLGALKQRACLLSLSFVEVRIPSIYSECVSVSVGPSARRAH